VDKQRWARVQSIFAAARGRPRAEWRAHAIEAADGDTEVEREALALLAHDVTGEDKIEDIVRAAANTLVQETGARLEGRQLGAWRIVSHLADGGMGAVYLAERADGAYQQRVAVKLLNPALVSAPMRARLSTERAILARLQHRHIARLIDGGTTPDGAPYLVMEYIDGVPIDRYCDERGAGTSARLRLVQQVCAAVEHAHRNLIVHRDLKPANILVDREGLPKLLDFGIAKLIDDEGGVTRADQRVLTPAHASPEQLRGEAITTATDVYALGVLLFQLLARRLPFPADPSRQTHSAQLVREILETDPPRPSQALPPGAWRLRRELGDDLDNIVLKALQKDPQRRYATAGALADDIENYLQDRPVSAHGDSFVYRLGKGLRRHRGPAAAALLLLVVAGGLTLYYTSRVTRERNVAEQERKTAEQVIAFMGSLFQSTSPTVNADPNLRVRDVVREAAGRIETELAGQPAAQRRLLGIIGGVYLNLTLWTEAEKLLRKAIALDEIQGGGPTAERARLWASLSGTLAQQQDARSIEAARRALELYADALGPNAFETIQARIRLASRLGENRRSDEALVELTNARQQLDTVREVAQRAKLERWIEASTGRALLEADRIEEAIPHLQRTLALKPPDDRYDDTTAAAAGMLGISLRELGRFDAAAEVHRAQLARYAALQGVNALTTLVEMDLLSGAEIGSEHFDVAEMLSRYAVEHYPATGSPARLARLRHTLCVSLIGQARLDDARAQCAKVLELYRKSGSKLGIAIALGTLGSLDVMRGDTAGGVRMLDQALTLFRSMSSSGWLTLDAGTTVRGLALALLERGNVARAREVLNELLDRGGRDAQVVTSRLYLALVDGDVALGEGNPDAAAAAYDRARAALQKVSPTPRYQSLVLESGEAALRAVRGDREGARAELTRVTAGLRALRAPGDPWRRLAERRLAALVPAAVTRGHSVPQTPL